MLLLRVLSEGGTVDTTSMLETAFNSIKGDLLGAIAVALPIALGIVGAVFGIKYAIKFFKNVSGKA